MASRDEYILIEDMTTFNKGAIVQILNNNGLLICHEVSTGNTYVLNRQFTKEEFDATFVPNTLAARVLYGVRV